MAYDYLNDVTDDMFSNKKLNEFTLDIIMPFYERVLTKGKFVSQRWYFQRKMYELNKAYFYGYFNKNRRQLSPELKDKLIEYEQQRNQTRS